MYEISVEKYTFAKFYTITVGSWKLFWVRMRDIQKGLGIKNIFDLVKKFMVFLRLKIL